eukprot:TRINITY_DN31059_c0_g1_i1.p1 TRINITY_DN31059_c0_g1~~TRINITY_DN31059_c0_g1_i1.p1  ORF type:complete len:151 (-),score=52.46 TRINITY_DN31059_c0_g1_i1:166-618(-)
MLTALAYREQMSKTTSTFVKERAEKTTEVVVLREEMIEQKTRADRAERELRSVRAKFLTVQSLYEETQNDYVLAVAKLGALERIVDSRRELYRVEHEGEDHDPREMAREKKRIAQEDEAIEDAEKKAEGGMGDPADVAGVDWHLAACMLH